MWCHGIHLLSFRFSSRKHSPNTYKDPKLSNQNSSKLRIPFQEDCDGELPCKKRKEWALKEGHPCPIHQQASSTSHPDHPLHIQVNPPIGLHRETEQLTLCLAAVSWIRDHGADKRNPFPWDWTSGKWNMTHYSSIVGDCFFLRNWMMRRWWRNSSGLKPLLSSMLQQQHQLQSLKMHEKPFDIDREVKDQMIAASGKSGFLVRFHFEQRGGEEGEGGREEGINSICWRWGTHPPSAFYRHLESFPHKIFLHGPYMGLKEA